MFRLTAEGPETSQGTRCGVFLPGDPNSSAIGLGAQAELCQ